MNRAISRIYYTSSGNHVIFDITDPSFIPGKIPEHFGKDAKGEWFFQPANWFPHSSWYGSIADTQFSKFPMQYSIGYGSPEEAVVAAEQWEVEQEKRVRVDRANSV